MCLLHVGNDHDRRFAFEHKPQSIGGGDLACHGRQYLPVRDPSTDCGCDTGCRQGPETIPAVRESPMSNDQSVQIPLEPERYELTAKPGYFFDVDRRAFFKFLGAGIVIVCALKNASALQESGTGKRSSREGLPEEIGAWLHLGEDGTVTVYTGKVEVGQNIRTSLSQAVAEELFVPVGKVQLVMGDTQLTPFDMGTFGSRTTPTMSPQLRKAAASARELLVGLAASQWQ